MLSKLGSLFFISRNVATRKCSIVSAVVVCFCEKALLCLTSRTSADERTECPLGQPPGEGEGPPGAQGYALSSVCRASTGPSLVDARFRFIDLLVKCDPATGCERGR